MRGGILAVSLLAAIAGSVGAGAADGPAAVKLSRALAIEEARNGDASPHLLPLLERLASVQFDDGALSDAAYSRRRALHIALRAYGGMSLNTANAMVALADVQILRDRYVEAEPLLITALPMLEAKYGSENPALIGPLAALARIALARGDIPAAEAWAGRANAIALRYPKASSTEPLRVLGAVYAAELRYDEGERVLRAAVARDQQRHGTDNPETARSLAQLANLLLRARRFEPALPLIEQAIAIDQEHLGSTHPLIADDFADLGMIYGGLGRDDAAADALGFAVDLLTRGASQESPRLAYAELELAGVLRRLGENEDADAAFKDGKHILDKTADDERKQEGQT